MFRPEEDDHLIGQWWRKDGYEFQLAGIMYDREDWWYVMARGAKLNKHTQMLSCCLKPERYGFERIE